MPATVHQLFYVSAAAGALEPSAVQAILHRSRRNNGRADITGCLLFTGRTFAQVLEGTPQAVHELAERIARDPRHGKLRIVASNDVAARAYDRWAMGYLYSLDLEDRLRKLLDGHVDAVEVQTLLARMQPDEVVGALP